MRNLRNSMHVVIGFTILYFFINKTDFIEYAVWMKIVGLIIGGISGGLAGAIWEYGNKLLFKIEPNIKDVKLTAIGGILGFGVAVIAKDLLPNIWYYACIALVIADLIRATYVKYKK